MESPQTIAKDIMTIKHLDAIQKYGCCAFVFLWCLGIEPNDVKAIQLIDDAISQRIIDEECTVEWSKFGLWLTGRTILVDFVSIKNILSIKERTPVKYTYKGNSHWVGVEKGMIKFDPLGIGKSQCVLKGKPTEMRKLYIKGINS